jgi:hypothetical protein
MRKFSYSVSVLSRNLGPSVTESRLDTRFADICELQDSAASTYKGGSLTLSRQMNDE